MTSAMLLSPISPDVFSVVFAPTVTGAQLAPDEKLIMGLLSARLMDGHYQTALNLAGMYYQGTNIVPSLGISVPPELETLKAVLGWCAAGVDARSERLTVLGFRMPGQTSIDGDLQQIWQANNLDAESTLVHEQAMIYGRSYVVVGVGDDGPLISTESPHNMIGSWDIRRRELSAAYQTYYDVDPASSTYMSQLATLYTRDATIQLARSNTGPNSGKWVVQDRNQHGQGFVPVVMFAHKPTIKTREGVSAIADPWRNTQDRACRTLVSMEVAREFFAATKIFVLGATEESFRKSDGSLASAWETYTGRISGIEADAMGNLPQIQTVPGSSPDGFIRSLDHERQVMAGHTGLPPQYLGIYSDGNPASADAIRMSDFRLKMTADRLTVSFGNDWEHVMRMAMRVAGSLPDGAERMETDWAYTGIPTPNADAVTVTTQIAAGMIPPTSDDALAACGWSPVQRQRIADERKRFQGSQVLDQALAGLQKQDNQPFPGAAPQPMQPQQAMDGQQPAALAGLNAKRSTDGATAG